MELRLKRVALQDTYTIGKLYINGTYFCDTLEDKVHDLNKDGDLDDAGEAKIWGKTAIPYGQYSIILNVSPKFKRLLPRLLNVKGFDGVLIHSGNTAEDTHGCILVGKNTAKGMITTSRDTEKRLVALLAKEKTTIIIIE